MADTSEVVTRTGADAALRAKLRRDRSGAGKAGRAAIWTAVMIIGVLTLIPIARYGQQELETWRLLQADEAGVHRALAGGWVNSGSADYVETISELSLDLPKPDTETAALAARRAIAIDASRAHAWAALAWLEYSKTKKVTPVVLEALARSTDACPLCSQELMRWRVNFVLANWAAMPEAMRTRAFEQADLLRWMGENHVFLAEMGAKAKRAGIPFDTYRTAVKTPVRTIDLGPAPSESAPAPPASPGG